MISLLLLHKMSNKRTISTEKEATSFEKCDLKAPESVYCRTCLSTDNLVSIFSNSGVERMSHNLKIVTGLEIRKNDGLSQKICNKCLGICNLTLKFRHRSKQAEKALRGALSLERNVEEKEIKADTEQFLSDVALEIQPDIAELKVEKKEEDSPEDVPVEQMDFWKDTKPARVKKEKDAKPRFTRRRLARLVLPAGPPYACSICGKEYQKETPYRAHMRFHMNSFVCESCGKCFPSNHQMLGHKRAKHGLEKIHKCGHCDYRAAYKEALTIHERRHTGERPFVCDHCGMTFHRRGNLVQHLPVHLPDTNFQCSFCPHREKSKKRLSIHVGNVHREKHYQQKCPVCGKLFRANNHVHRHLSRVHRLPRAQHPPVPRVYHDHGGKDIYYTPEPPENTLLQTNTASET